MKVILSPNPYRDLGLRAAQSALKILQNSGVETAVCLPFTPEGQPPRADMPAGIKLTPLAEELPGADVLICFGGDGTILHAAKSANPFQIPVLGVNMGSVGFMAELEHSEMSLLGRLASGKYQVESRMMLQVEVRREGKVIFSDTALNDAVLTKGAVARVLPLEITGDRVPIYSYAGDGVVVSTPTGSTAYSMAAGGPIVEPSAKNIIVTPICAHDVSSKSIVASDKRVITVQMVQNARRNAFLSVDGGKSLRMNMGDVATIRKSNLETKLVRLKDRSFFDVVNSKFKKS